MGLHNDKKWVQEKTQRITEHLLSQQTLGNGISTDFVKRGLRQMSIKQFVAIINYFLNYIWGTRFTVGSNHVEDIIKILQKLNYPHPLNKSWLKTPNTQHSFGNVIVLLDFLMDFVPSGENDGTSCNFDLKEPEEISTSRLNDDPYQIPDLEFQQELLKNSENGFVLWDKQKNDEFENLQLHTCNLLIQKLCGIANIEALDVEIENLEKTLKQLKSERPPEDKEKLKIKSKLMNELKTFRRQIKILQEECDMNDGNLKDFNTRRSNLEKEIKNIDMEIKSLQERLNSQKCSVEQRNEMMADMAQHKQIVAIKERSIKDLESRYDKQQILHGEAIKHLNNNIEKFNNHMREIKYSDLLKENIGNNASLNNSQLELSLRPKQSEFNKIIPLLEAIKEKAAEGIQSNKTELYRIQVNCKQLTNDMDTKLHPTLNSLRAANTSNVAELEKLLIIQKQEECKILETVQKSNEDLIMSDKTINELNSLIAHKKSLVEEFKVSNEQTMSHAEEKHRQCLDQRRAFLQAYKDILDECIQSDVLEKLSQQINLQEKQLEELNKNFQK